MTRPAYRYPRASLSLVALGLSASDAGAVVDTLPGFADDTMRAVYVSRVALIDLPAAGAWCRRYGLTGVRHA